MNLAQNIQMLRRRACLSQEELASQLGVSRQSVSKWESDAATPELDKLTQMAHLFHVSLDELVGELPPEDAAPQQPGQPPAAAPAGRKRRMLPWLLWAASALLCLWLGAAFFSPSPSEQPMEPSLSQVQTLSLPALRQSLVATFLIWPPQSALTTSPFSRRETRPGMPMSIFSMPSPCDLTSGETKRAA